MFNIILNQVIPPVLVLAVLGYLLSRWRGKRPSGLLHLSEMTSKISGDPNWQLPIVLIGLLISYLANVGAYAVFFIVELIRFIAWLLVWIYEKVLLFIYNNIIRQTLVMGILLLVRYCFIIPLKVLVSVVHAVPDAIQAKNLRTSIVSGLIFFLILSIGHFIAYLMEAPALAMVFTISSTVLLSTYLTGRLVFGNTASGNKALSFAFMIIAIAVAGFVLAFLLNLGDAMQRSGGILAGLVYAPGLISMTATLLACLSALFVANIGAIYINSVPGQGLINGLKGFVIAIFQRAWFFLFQGAFALVVGAILLSIPFLVGRTASQIVLDELVVQRMDSKQSELQSQLEAVAIGDKIEAYCSADTSADAFNKAVSNISQEFAIRTSLEENTRYRTYFSKEMSFIDFSQAITTKEQHRQHIEALDKMLQELRRRYSKDAENRNQQLEQMKKQVEETKTLYSSADGSNSYLESMEKQYERMKLESDRRNAVNDSTLVAKTGELTYWESSSPYDAGSFIAFLLSKTVLWAILLAVFFTLFAFSTRKVYDLYNSSYLAELIKEEQRRSPYQPWAAFLFAVPTYMLIVALLTGLLGEGFSVPKIDLPDFNSGDRTEEANPAASDPTPAEGAADPGFEYAAEDINGDYPPEEMAEDFPADYMEMGEASAVAVEPDDADPGQVYTYAEEQPTFPGGESAMYEFLQQNINYPPLARENGITGRVYLSFIVGSDGNLRDIKVLRGIGAGCDEEALRVVANMPSWIPGRQGGRPVNVQFNMPVNFTLR